MFFANNKSRGSGLSICLLLSLLGGRLMSWRRGSIRAKQSFCSPNLPHLLLRIHSFNHAFPSFSSTLYLGEAQTSLRHWSKVSSFCTRFISQTLCHLSSSQNTLKILMIRGISVRNINLFYYGLLSHDNSWSFTVLMLLWFSSAQL